jgi:two-component system, NarL family, invasion response regulator UvrY
MRPTVSPRDDGDACTPKGPPPETLDLRPTSAHVVAMSAQGIDDRPDEERPKLFVVEDDERVAAAVAMVATAAGFDVVGAASTVADATASLCGDGPHADLVLVDVQLPDGSGVDVATATLECTPGQRVVLMSSYAAEDLPLEVWTCGAEQFLPKDEITLDRLESLIH